MSPLSLLLLALSSSVPTAPVDGLAMPPPPAGMRELNADDKRLLLGNAAEPDAEAPEAEDGGDNGSEEREAESAELEQLRALEGATLDPSARPNAEVLQTLRRLGLANPLRQRMLDVMEEPTLREDDTPAPLPLITDIANFDVSQVRDRYDIPVDMQPLVAQYVEFFQGPGRRFFRKWVSRSTRYIPMMQRILEAKGLPRDTVYLAMIESGFSPHAYSWAHASGPWQFISSTGRQYGLRQDFWVDERRDPVKATHAAAAYLKDLHKELGHWYLAWAGYNTGSSRVRRMMGRYSTTDFWVLAVEPGLAKETKHYVPKLIAAALIAKNPEAFGFSQDEFDFDEPMAFETVKLADPTDLDVIARAAGVSVKAIQDLNPELKRWCTPPASEKNPYVLRVPTGGAAARFAQNFPKIAPQERLTFRVHKVTRGDTLSAIAVKYGSAMEAILQMNQLKATRKLRLGTELVVPVPVDLKRGQTVLASKVVQARRAGVVALRPEDEIPAGTPKPPVASGPMKTETINGRTRVTYGVQDGDSLWAIANRFNVSVEDLQGWNNLGRRKRTLSVGTVLHVYPKTASAQVEERGGTVVAHRAAGAKRSATHTLAAGETLWSVAQRYGVTVEDIMRWNRIKDHRTLPTGKQLQVVAP